MNKKKLIELRCKAWGITEDEYYCNQCSDFSLEDMARAYRRGKNKGFDKAKQLEAQIEKMKCCSNCDNWNWKHNKCEKKLKGDCFKHSKWVLRKILSKEYE